MIATGGAASRLIGSASAPNVSTRASLTILMTICPGVTDLITAAPTARSRTLSVNERTTSSATSASSSARRTSRRAAVTSASESAPRRVSPSKMPDSLSDRPSNMETCLSRNRNAKRARGRDALPDGRLAATA